MMDASETGEQCPHRCIHSLDDTAGESSVPGTQLHFSHPTVKLKMKVKPFLWFNHPWFFVFSCTCCYRLLSLASKSPPSCCFRITVPPRVTGHQCDCKTQQRTENSSLCSSVLWRSSWWWALTRGGGVRRRGMDNTGQLVVIIHTVTNKVSSCPGLLIFSMLQSAPFVHSSFFHHGIAWNVKDFSTHQALTDSDQDYTCTRSMMSQHRDATEQ